MVSRGQFFKLDISATMLKLKKRRDEGTKLKTALQSIMVLRTRNGLHHRLRTSSIA